MLPLPRSTEISDVFNVQAPVRPVPVASPVKPHHDGEAPAVKLIPRALWIIGNNGRVDLKCGGRHYLIIDTADNFEKPRWEVSRADRRSDREAVTRDWLRRVLQ